MKLFYPATFLFFLSIITISHSVEPEGRGRSPESNNLLIIPNVSVQPQYGTISKGPNGLVATQAGNITYYSNGPSSITNGNKTVYSNGKSCVTNNSKTTCN